MSLRLAYMSFSSFYRNPAQLKQSLFKHVKVGRTMSVLVKTIPYHLRNSKVMVDMFERFIFAQAHVIYVYIKTNPNKIPFHRLLCVILKPHLIERFE